MFVNKKILSFISTLLLALPCFALNKTPVNPWELAALGVQPSLTQVNLSGKNDAIPATFETMWPESAQYDPLAVALSSPYCASSSTNDTAAGTGARTISISGLDTSFARFTETITMNGQTSVSIVTTNVLLIDKIEVLTAGSGGLNAGIVQCGTGSNTSGDPAVPHAYLPISSLSSVAGAGNKTESFIYGVAAGKTLICRNFSAGSVFATQASGLEFVVDGYTNLGLVKRYVWERGAQAGSPVLHSGIVKFPEKTIIIGRMAGPTGSNVGPASLTAECILVSNSYLEQPESIF